MTRLEELCAEAGIKCEAKQLDTSVGSDSWAPGTTHWKVTLKLGRKRLMTPFHQGSGILEDPDAASVLYCLCADANSVDGARSFEDWCDELGYDSDSRKAHQTYKECRKAEAKVRRFLGERFAEFCNAEH